MKEAYKENAQFIVLLIIMYVVGVWGGPIIYLLFPLLFGMFGLKGLFFEMLITSLWMLILSDYVPVKNATHDDLQFAKDLKPIIPIFLFGFYVIHREKFSKISKAFINFIPFFIIILISTQYSIKMDVAIKKYLSYLLMYFSIPMYVNYLHKEYGSHFWNSLLTFIIWMLVIGLLLGTFVPQIGMIAGGRFKGILGNPNGLGIFLNLTFILWLTAKELKLTTFSVKENRFILFVILFSLFWSGSRNGMMSIFLFYLIFRLTKIHWSIAIVAVSFVFVFEELMFSSFIALIEFFQMQEFFRVDSIEKGSGRKIAWVFAWIIIEKKFFFLGGGFANDENIMRPNYKMLSMQGHQGGVHNSYLSMWFDGGLIGLMFYFLGLLKSILFSLKGNYIGLAFLFSILFNITYESWLVASLNPFSILFLIILTIFVENLKGEEKINSLSQPQTS